MHLFYFLEEDISEEEEVKTNETGSISQKRSHSEVCKIITIDITLFCYCKILTD